MIVLDAMEYATDAAAKAAYHDALCVLNFAETDGNFIDTGAAGLAITNNSVAYSASGKFDNAAYFAADPNNLVMAPSSIFNTGFGDFTYDLWINFHSWDHRMGIFSFTTDCYLTLVTAGTRQLGFAASASGAWGWPINHVDYGFGATKLTIGQWYHLALVKHNTDLRLYLNGVSELYDTMSFALRNPSSIGFQIGKYGAGEWQGLHNVSISGFRFSNYARWTSTFTPPTRNPDEPAVSSDGTIKQQGSYALKIVAPAGISLNSCTRRILSPSFNLSGQKDFKMWVRTSRIGSNFKIGLHDSGGTTTEVTPNIAVADEFQEITVDLSSVADADKDAIDLIIYTHLNADAETTVYLDWLRTLSSGEGTGGGGGIEAIGVSILTDTGWKRAI